jgi:hypothetical protein
MTCGAPGLNIIFEVSGKTARQLSSYPGSFVDGARDTFYCAVILTCFT